MNTKKKKVFMAFSCMLLLSACGSVTTENLPSATLVVLSTATSEPTDLPVLEEEAGPEAEISTEEPTVGPDCLGPDVNEIGLSIADRFEGASYEEVMTWFCNGAEFEDILLALQSEQQGEAKAEEMLFMLADGFTWDEIWQLVGITE